MPIPRPTKQEKRGKYIDRCMDSIAGEYDDPKQAAAVCNSKWAEVRMGKTDKKELTVEIFAAGKWNGMDFTVDDLKMMAGAFHALAENHQVPLKMGHNDEQPFTDGQPALGWVSDLWVEGTMLLAKFSDVPKIVYDAMSQNLYKNVSVELDFSVQHKGDYYPAVLSGVALLGADIPAVNTLADLDAYMSKDIVSFKRVVFTATKVKPNSFSRSDDMSVEQQEEIASLKLTVTAQQKEIAKAKEENVLLQSEIDQGKAEFKVVHAAEETRKLGETRKGLVTRLEGMVKEGKISPATRDEFMREFDDAKDKAVITFAVERLEKTIDANPAYFGAEQARIKADKEKNELDKDADEVVLQRTNEFMAKHGEKNFAIAKTSVLRADPALAERYTKGGA